MEWLLLGGLLLGGMLLGGSKAAAKASPKVAEEAHRMSLPPHKRPAARHRLKPSEKMLAAAMAAAKRAERMASAERPRPGTPASKPAAPAAKSAPAPFVPHIEQARILPPPPPTKAPVRPPAPAALVPEVPKLPAGYDPQLAKKLAPKVAVNVRDKGKWGYDRKLMRQYQTAAGVEPDGFYGKNTRASLVHFGIKNPPRELF